MKLIIPKGATSRIVPVFIAANNVTTGAGLGSLTSASGIVGGYMREGGTGVALAVDEAVATPGTYQAPSSAAHVRIGTPANMRTGVYELHFHNNLWATGAESLVISLGGATNMAELLLEVQLDLTSATVQGLSATGLDAILIEAAIAASASLTNDSGEQLTSINARQAMSAMLSALAGLLSGVTTNAPAFKPGGKPSGNTRIAATQAADGRTTVVLKVPD